MKVLALMTLVFSFMILSCNKKTEETTMYDEPMIATDTAQTSTMPLAPDTTTVIPVDSAGYDVDTISTRP